MRAPCQACKTANGVSGPPQAWTKNVSGQTSQVSHYVGIAGVKTRSGRSNRRMQCVTRELPSVLLQRAFACCSDRIRGRPSRMPQDRGLWSYESKRRVTNARPGSFAQAARRALASPLRRSLPPDSGQTTSRRPVNVGEERRASQGCNASAIWMHPRTAPSRLWLAPQKGDRQRNHNEHCRSARQRGRRFPKASEWAAGWQTKRRIRNAPNA